MPLFVTSGAICTCSCGSCPATLNCLPKGISAGKSNSAVITDTAPGVNLISFGVCTLRTASGIPLPCAYAPAGTWIPTKPTVSIKYTPSLLDNSMLMCSTGGVIKIIWAGQALVTG